MVVKPVRFEHATRASVYFMLACLVVLPWAGASHAQAQRPDVTFERDVMPIFAARCLGCHGGVTQKAGLDLRNRESILKGSRKGSILTLEKPDESTLWKVLAKDTMPLEEPALSAREKEVIRRWIASGAPDAATLRGNKTPAKRTTARPSQEVANELDWLIDDYLRGNKLPAAPHASDAELLRRLHLDLTGRIPEAQKVAKFLADTSADKNERELEALLNDPAHARQLAELWHNAMVPLDLNRRFFNTEFLDWLTERIHKNEPWNRTIHQILSATGDSRVNPALGFYVANRRPNLMAREATRIFLGVRLECVQCHDHPFANWTQADYWGMAAFFSRTQIKRETEPKTGFIFSEADQQLFGASSQPGMLKIPGNAIRAVGREVKAHFLDGSTPVLTEKSSYRQAYADWVATGENPLFARAVVNRLWANYFGRGLVEPVDDLVGLEPPAVPGVLDLLADELAASSFDVRHLIRCICSTRAYRRSSRPVPENETDLTGLSHMRLKPLSPAMLHDSLCVALDVPTVDLAPDPTGKSPLGANARTRFINLFNTQDAEEESDQYSHGVLQALRLMNGKAFDLKAEQLARILPPKTTLENAIEHLYLRTLTRRPTDAELRRMQSHVRNQPTLEAGYADVLWALVNSIEFLMNH